MASENDRLREPTSRTADGCRARTATKACVRASNLANGRAFSFSSSSGTEVGRIDGPATAAPFTTSATGVATGLNGGAEVVGLMPKPKPS